MFAAYLPLDPEAFELVFIQYHPEPWGIAYEQALAFPGNGFGDDVFCENFVDADGNRTFQ